MSTIAIKVNGVDITADVVITEASFISQVNGVAGTAKIRVRDDARNKSFMIGQSLTLDIDGSRSWTGFVQSVQRAYSFPAQNTAIMSSVSRFLDLTGIDINILFNKRIVFKQGDETSMYGPTYTSVTADSTVIAALTSGWLDLTGDGIDTASLVETVDNVNIDQEWNGWNGGETWQAAMATIIKSTGAIFYLDPDKKLVYTDVDTPTAPYALSDKPTAGQVGYAKMEILNDGSDLANDVLAWGVGGGSDTAVFSRAQSTSSQTSHGIWQYGTLESGVWKQATIDHVSSVYLNGSPQSKRGHKDDRVSVLATVYTPGFRVAQKVTFISHAFGWSDVIPIRRMEITFPTPTDVRYRLTLSHEIDLPASPLDPVTITVPGIPPIEDYCWWCGSGGGTVGCTDAICGITDTFDRVSSAGWGSTSYGLTWIESSHSMTWSTDGTHGTITNNGASSQTDTVALALSALTFPITVEFVFNLDASFITIGNTAPAMNCQIFTDVGQAGISANRVAGNTTAIEWYVFGTTGSSIPRIAAPADCTCFVDIRAKFEITASGVNAKLWKDGTTEPGSWQITYAEDLSTWLVNPFFTWFPTLDPGQSISLSDLDISGVNACTEYRFDNFNRAVASGMGASDYGSAWSQLATINAGLSVDGNNLVRVDDGSATYGSLTAQAAGPVDGDFTLTARWMLDKIPTAANNDRPWRIAFGVSSQAAFNWVDAAVSLVVDSSSGSVAIGEDASGNGSLSFGEAVSYTKTDWQANAWYMVKWERSVSGAVSRAKLWIDGTPEPDWQVSNTSLSAATPTQVQLHGDKDARITGTPVLGTLYVDYINIDYDGKPCYGCSDSFTLDTFSRTVASSTTLATSGWGTSERNLAWTCYSTAGSASSSVNGTRGLFSLPNSSGRSLRVPSASPWGDETEFTMTSTVRFVTLGTYAELGVFGVTSGGGAYTKIDSNVNTVYLNGANATAFTLLANTDYYVKLNVVYGSSTNLRIWKTTDTEPSTWTVSTTCPARDTTGEYFRVTGANFSGSGPKTIQIDNISFAGTCSPTTGAATGGLPLGGFVCETLSNLAGTTYTTTGSYQPNTLEVYVNGVLQRLGTDYTETSPGSGTFTLSFLLSGSDVLRVCYVRVTGDGGSYGRYVS